MKALDRVFFARPTLDVARELLGSELVFNECAGIITETEAYIGQDDPACHAARGRTARNGVLWGEPGHAYVYFTYGMHHCVNIVTEPEGFPAAVLIRAIAPTHGIEQMRLRRERGPALRRTARRHSVADRNLANGPAKLCEALGIDLKCNGLDLCRTDSAMLVRDTGLRLDFVNTGRIGISQGGDRLWRFVGNSDKVGGSMLLPKSHAQS